MWENMRECKTIVNNPCLQITDKLQLLSRMDYTVKILLCPLVFVVNIDDAISTETSLICKER
jgi:hypothetical protein